MLMQLSSEIKDSCCTVYSIQFSVCVGMTVDQVTDSTRKECNGKAFNLTTWYGKSCASSVSFKLVYMYMYVVKAVIVLG